MEDFQGAFYIRRLNLLHRKLRDITTSCGHQILSLALNKE